MSGNVAVIYALSLVPAMVAAGAAVDFISALNAKTELQNAIDAATLAGAAASNNASAAANVFAAEPKSSFAAISAPVFSTNGDGSFTGKVTATVATNFLPMAGIKSMSVSASATAKMGASTSVCVLILNKNNSQTLLMNSGADIEASQCEVDVASTASPAAIFNGGSTLNTKKTCIASSSILDNGGTHPNLSTKCAVQPDPFAGKLPVPSTSAPDCNGGNYNGGPVVLSPGVYCGWYNFNNAPSVSFQPGVYVIKGGGWNVNGGTWSGTGVTFYFADSSKIQFNSGVSASLSAPSSGSYAGILMYEAPGLSSSQFLFDDSKGHNLDGLIYLPSRQLVMNSGATVSSDHVTVVVDSLIVNSSTWTIAPQTTLSIAGSSGSGSPYLMK
ncbi:hypothetical protein FHS83_000535 [Rhizomicrobium palustre]|uniref:Putative Flp pilus-assembly TadG-like N-terminal domain-containing protein n=1 Tax=Rhizomicrobium palustre TaxID=189966 RepID=A0A846MW50_9PROT|nr:Tad domain-containing protein [Rhizomicrobium palustre]NIK87217.1 hypothetical protein [Rhizomicrobium palustre]